MLCLFFPHFIAAPTVSKSEIKTKRHIKQAGECLAVWEARFSFEQQMPTFTMTLPELTGTLKTFMVFKEDVRLLPQALCDLKCSTAHKQLPA